MLLPLHARTAQHQHNSSSSNRVPVCPVSRRRSPRKRAKRSHCFYKKKKPLKISDRYSLSCTCDRRPLSPRLSITPLSPRLLPGASLTFSQWSVRFDAAQLSDSKARRTQRPCAISRSKHWSTSVTARQSPRRKRELVSTCGHKGRRVQGSARGENKHSIILHITARWYGRASCPSPSVRVSLPRRRSLSGSVNITSCPRARARPLQKNKTHTLSKTLVRFFHPPSFLHPLSSRVKRLLMAPQQRDICSPFLGFPFAPPPPTRDRDALLSGMNGGISKHSSTESSPAGYDHTLAVVVP